MTYHLSCITYHVSVVMVMVIVMVVVMIGLWFVRTEGQKQRAEATNSRVECILDKDEVSGSNPLWPRSRFCLEGSGMRDPR